MGGSCVSVANSIPCASARHKPAAPATAAFFSLGLGAKMFCADGADAILVHPFCKRIMYDEDRSGFSGRNEFALPIGVAVYSP